MNNLVRIIYISRATFKSTAPDRGVEPTVARILQASRMNNPRQNIGGVLYYGDGCFFQCLEGEQDVVTALLSKLKRDDRHTDFQVIHQARAKARQFSNWSMKYIPSNERVKSILMQNGYDRFDPYQFDQAMFNKLLQAFRLINDESGRSSERSDPASGDAQQPLALKLMLPLVLVVGVAIGALALWYLGRG